MRYPFLWDFHDFNFSWHSLLVPIYLKFGQISPVYTGHCTVSCVHCTEYTVRAAYPMQVQCRTRAAYIYKHVTMQRREHQLSFKWWCYHAPDNLDEYFQFCSDHADEPVPRLPFLTKNLLVGLIPAMLVCQGIIIHVQRYAGVGAASTRSS